MIENDPLWYKDAIIYELHVRAFHDSIGDGGGDFRGMTQKLDYLADLGVSAIWLLPFYPSPLRDDGYDIADYTNIHSHYGTLRDFRDFLDAAHERGLRVITELVINHTSDQHPWFQRARRSPPGSPERDFYVWSDTPDRYKEARIIFKDFEASNWTYDPLAKAYYWHRFYYHQPDLNYDNPEVWKAIFPVLDFWLELGVDGMRLDAVPYLYEREGTNCENLPETHKFLKALRRHIDEKHSNRMLLSEANQWPEDAAAYFGQGDESHMAFHFPLMPRMFMAIHMEDRFPILDIMAQTPALPENCQWVLFLRNHDELTLEMVTDEERDYMYRAYATDPDARINLGIRRRLGPLLGNNRRRIELMNGLLFSLPGTPVLYYGDEIGMGDNIYLGDRNGVRTPMQWSADRNAGFSHANPQKLYLPVIIDPEYHHAAVNVEAQQKNPNSLLWWMKRIIALRKRHKSFGRGTLQFLQPANRKILAFLRRYQDECILVVANLSRFVQYAELDLAEFQGLVPVELFSRNSFPPVSKQPYMLTFGPHSFFWFSLERQRVREQVHKALPRPDPIPTLRIQHRWEELLHGPGRDRLEEVLPAFLTNQLSTGNSKPPVKNVVLQTSFPLKHKDALAFVNLAEAEIEEGPREMFLLPVSYAAGEEAKRVQERAPAALWARLTGSSDGVLYDSLADPHFCEALLEAIAAGRRYFVSNGELVATSFGADLALGSSEHPLTPAVSQGEGGNACITYGRKYVLKVFRRLESDVNPDLEMSRYLVERRGFTHVAPVRGVIEFRHRRGKPTTLAILHDFVPSEGDAWQLTLDQLSLYFEHVLSLGSGPEATLPRADLLAPPPKERPALVREFLDAFLERVSLLGQRTAQMHTALAAETDDPSFTPEPFTTLYQRSLYQSMRNLVRLTLEQLRHALPDLSETECAAAQKTLECEPEILRRFLKLVEGKIDVMRTRYHGDFNLGHVLSTGRDFNIIGFEGEPNRSVTDRRLKRSPMRDVVTMLRSFHYAGYSALWGFGTVRGRSPGLIRLEEIALLEPWVRFWYEWVSAAFFWGYLEHANGAAYLPRSSVHLKTLLEAFLLEKALYELRHELTQRRGMVALPLKGILQLLS